MTDCSSSPPRNVRARDRQRATFEKVNVPEFQTPVGDQRQKKGDSRLLVILVHAFWRRL